MLGAIVGDLVGSVYEFSSIKTKSFQLIHPGATVTDDSILTVAVADWLLHGGDLTERFHQMVDRYPAAGWGMMFARWAGQKRREPYQSFGNGSAMRVSPVGWAFDTLEETLAAAARTAEVTHNHPEGVKGAQATAAAVFLARTRRDKDEIRSEITSRFGYDLSFTTEAIRPSYRFNETCQQTVPEAIVAFLDSSGFEDALRNAISLGGDADTLGAITGAIAHAFYGEIPGELAETALRKLPVALQPPTAEFLTTYRIPGHSFADRR